MKEIEDRLKAIEEKLDEVIESLNALRAMQSGVEITYTPPFEIHYPPEPSPTAISGGSYP